MNETLGKMALWLSFRRLLHLHADVFWALRGNIRRYSEFTDDYLIRLIPLHRFITVAALFTGAVQFIFQSDLEPFSRATGHSKPPEATTLEWSTSSSAV